MEAEGNIVALGSYLKVEVLKKFTKEPNEDTSILGQKPKFALLKVLSVTEDTKELAEKEVVAILPNLIAKGEQFFIHQDNVMYEWTN